MAQRAPGPAAPGALPDDSREDPVRPFPRPAPAGGVVGPLAERVARATRSRRGSARPAPRLIPSELVTALAVELPRAPARRRAAMLAFAVEERVGVPIEAVVVAEARLDDPAALPGTHLALVISRAALAAAAAAAPGAALLPDFLALRRPEAPPGGAAWAVWREGGRAVVRRSDGTGFAVATDALPALWVRAGRPALLSLGAALPTGLPATDLSAAPPGPNPSDLAFSFRGSAGSEGLGAALGPLATAAGIAGVALLFHLALAAADAAALGRIAAAERAAAEAAIAPVLPGVALGPDVDAVLARLAPTPPEARRSDFLPLLAEVSAALAGTGVGFRRLGWGAEDGTLSLLVQGAALDDLQAAEAAIRDAGLAVTSGAASAGEGGAEVEMRVARGDAG
jgi:general secretion pathway protein L